MINKDRAKPRELNPSVKRLIYYRAITQRKIPREFLANELIKEINEAGEIPPSLETAKRYISKARNIDDPIDKPWSLAVLNRLHEWDIFDINADAIECIMKVQYYVDNDFREYWSGKIKENTKKGDPEIDQALITDELIAKAQGQYPILTIRQAKWVARLYRLQSDNIHRLYFTALLYSNYEIVSEISGTSFNTEILDRALFNWSDFSDLIGEYSNTSQSDDNLRKATARSFNPEQKNEGEE